jgi:NAD(P)-dependent dehydrogenase (short-subunit alcohol dehydrogenase family)
MDLHLHGSAILITGGTDGLGAALAQKLVEEGASVGICGRDPNRLETTRNRLVGLGGDVLAVQADVTRPEQLEYFVDAAAERWGRLDGLVNNAGRSSAGRVEQVTDQEWTGDLELKLLAAVRAVRLTLPHLRAAGGGSIVNVLAVSAKVPGAGSLPTSASRAAGLALTKSTAANGGAGPRKPAKPWSPCMRNWLPIRRFRSAGWAAPTNSPTWPRSCSRIARRT